MFGIKTKKDKRIEALEEQLNSMYFKHPTFINAHGNMQSLGAIQILEEGMPPEYAKRMIAQKLVEGAIPYIHYDLEQHGTKTVLKGYIQIIVWGAE